MGIFDAFSKQFIAVIDWTEEEDGVLAYRFPMKDQEIQNGAQLTVRESQLALFVNEGEVADLLGPGLHTLTTRNLPLLTTLNNWDKAFHSPFKSDVYFYSTREQIDQKWGTPNPVTVRDKEMGAIRLRAFGTHSYRIKNPNVFYKKLSGTRERYTVQDLEGQLRSAIITSLSAFFGQSSVAFLDMASNQVKFSDTLRDALGPTFSNYGLELTSFFVQSISLPEELQAYLTRPRRCGWWETWGSTRASRRLKAFRPRLPMPAGSPGPGPAWARASPLARRWLRRWEAEGPPVLRETTPCSRSRSFTI